MPSIVILGGTSIVLPSDWNPTNNTIECIGGGQGGAIGDVGYGYGGFGGSYARISNFGSAGQTLYFGVGSGGNGFSVSGTPGGDTWIGTSSSGYPINTSQGVLAAGGASGRNSVGTLTRSGGGQGTPFDTEIQYRLGGGGGGAGGAVSPGGAGGTANGTGGGTGGLGGGGSWTASYTVTPTGAAGLSLAPAGTVVQPGNGGTGANGGEAGMSGYYYGGGGGGGSYDNYGGAYWEGGYGGNGVIILTYTLATVNTGSFFALF